MAQTHYFEMAYRHKIVSHRVQKDAEAGKEELNDDYAIVKGARAPACDLGEDPSSARSTS